MKTPGWISIAACVVAALSSLNTVSADTCFYGDRNRFAVSSLGETSIESELVEAPIIQGK